MSDRILEPFQILKPNYVGDILPDFVRITDNSTARFNGVNACSNVEIAKSNAIAELTRFTSLAMKYNPQLEIVRSGWMEGLHY